MRLTLFQPELVIVVLCILSAHVIVSIAAPISVIARAESEKLNRQYYEQQQAVIDRSEMFLRRNADGISQAR